MNGKELTDELAIAWWMELLQDELPDDRKDLLDAYLRSRPALAAELQDSTQLWHHMAELTIPEPSDGMDRKFESMLYGYGLATSGKRRHAETLFNWLGSRWLTGIAALITGMVIGWLVLPGTPNAEVRHLSAEVADMKKMLVLSMIEKPQAQERIKAVGMVSELNSPDEKVISALFSTLNQDPNMNVRLAALETLTAYGHEAAVRRLLVQSIALQDSPLLQVALADAMILLQEKSAVAEFSKMLSSDQVDETVKTKLKSTIQELREI